MKEKWYLQSKKADFFQIGQKFNIDPIIARLIRNRDVIELDDIEKYLNPNIDNMSSPWLFKDMDKAVDILKIKISQENKIRIICDYDVDGICSGYILLSGLKEIGANVDVVVPNRIEDGYGINISLIEKAIKDEVDTIITCDNGIAASKEIAYGKEQGLTFIITDHHEVPFEEKEGKREYIIPKADAVIDQKQLDCEYPFKELCGTMVSYQLLSGLYDSMEKASNNLKKYLAYGAMATVCDIVDLKGENRAIVKYGLELLRKIDDVGINALITQCNIDKNTINTYHLGFIVGPCLNASGRLESAKIAINLLNEKDSTKANELAIRLKELNDERKSITEEGTEKAIDIAKNMTENILVIYLQNCHESVAGIIAGRVREKYNKPTIVLTDAKDNIKGSGRSIENYDMYTELTKVKEYLLKFGGHKMAAGVSLEKDKIEDFRNALNKNASLTEDDLALKVYIDMQLPIEYVTMNLINQLDYLQPTGKGNEKPVFAEKNLKVKNMKILGKTGNVIKLNVENESGYRMNALIFGRSKEFLEFLNDKFGNDEINNAMEGKNNSIVFMATYYPNINEFRGNKEVQLVIDRFC